MKIISIVAVSENNVIGVNGRIPWHIPEDLRRFKSETKGHAVIMGRRTWESLPITPLRERMNIILATDANFVFQGQYGCIVTRWLEAAFDYAEQANKEKAFLIGGENIYREGLKYCDEVLLTRVHEAVKHGPNDVVTRFDTELIRGSWGVDENYYGNWIIEDLGETSDGRASFYRYVRVR